MLAEVEKQLNRGAPTPQLPNKKQRSGSSSSSKQHLAQSQDDLPPPLNASNAAATHQTGTTRSTRSHEDHPRGTSMDRLEGGGEHQQPPLLSSFGAASGAGVQQRDNVRDEPSAEAVLSQGPRGILTTKSTVVQLRRNTNKQGRQAPTPPRRTR